MPKSNVKLVRDRKDFLAAHVSRSVGTKLTPKAIDDLRYFEAQAKTGRALTWPALAKWMEEECGLRLGRTRLRRLATEAGITPWWCA